jgi:hypothetical protein
MAIPPLPPKPAQRVSGTIYMRGECAVMAMGPSGQLRIVCGACGKRATFGMRPVCPRGCKRTLHCGPRWCTDHAPAGAFDVANLTKRCPVVGCTRQLSGGARACAGCRRKAARRVWEARGRMRFADARVRRAAAEVDRVLFQFAPDAAVWRTVEGHGALPVHYEHPRRAREASTGVVIKHRIAQDRAGAR